ncbi:hypothetical protein LJK87_13265 [Paenibacillus sp. P25]|nr:hypothetical protein LJK87_13265 [Paenibacillus sp. P25]
MTTIRFLDLKIGNINHSSGVYYGTNRQYGFQHRAKQNQAFGTVDGEHCHLSDTHSSLTDNDHMDHMGAKGKPDSP